jgi:alkanesulfonate monooxygenase SsuD/methylene tetrahydromethanopterin reductase-like flavin-dependent oxidoreductase (luciferase family)
MNVPAPLSRIPVLIGGGGERKTLRLVAQYADESNLICGVNDIPRKLEVLADHCENLGRDRSEITVSYQTSACIAPTHEQAVAELENYLSRTPQAQVRRRTTIVGSPDEVAEQYTRLRDTGIDGVTVNAPPNGHVEGRVALLGETLAPLFIR